MYPLSLFESNDSTQQIDIQQLFREKNLNIAGYGGLKIEQYAQKIITGGWPGLIEKSEKQAQIYLSNYLDDISRVNIGSDIYKTDPVRMRALIRAISRNISTETPITKLAAEAGLIINSISQQTARKYIDQLIQIFVLQELPASITTKPDRGVRKWKKQDDKSNFCGIHFDVFGGVSSKEGFDSGSGGCFFGKGAGGSSGLSSLPMVMGATG